MYIDQSIDQHNWHSPCCRWLTLETAIDWCVKNLSRAIGRRRANGWGRTPCVQLPRLSSPSFNLNQDYVTSIRHIHIIFSEDVWFSRESIGLWLILFSVLLARQNASTNEPSTHADALTEDKILVEIDAQLVCWMSRHLAHFVCYLPRRCFLVCLHTHTHTHAIPRHDASVGMKAIAK